MEKPLTQHIKNDGTWLSLKEYERTGGYRALRKTVKMNPKDVTEIVKNSGLKGRGGAGFGTGMKWGFVPVGDDAPLPKYFVANADEMEPGSFKDRLLLEGNPHQLLEGLIISSFAVQANYCYIFLRWAYHRAAEAITHAIEEAYNAGYLGKDILGSGYNLDASLHISVGRYMCGEETGLLNALEGKRANPRNKPPFPQTSGLFGKPTVVNNVETLCNVPHIIVNGAEWFKNLAKTDDAGTKIYGASGRVKNPGLYELPMGTTLGEIMEEHAGGMLEGYKFKGVQPGGGSTDFLTAGHWDIPLDYHSVMAAGSRLGTGTLIVLDDKTCPVGMVLNLERFFAQESCGWCTPCREGLPWTAKTLEAIENGKGEMRDLDILEFHTEYMGMGNTYCALAPGAMEPLQSALKYFREDFEKHIHEHKCPWKKEW